MASQRKDQDGLTPQQRRFCLELLSDPQMVGAAAARRAGYSAHTAEVQASKLLRHPKVAAFLEKRRARVEARLELTAERIDQEIARLAFLDVRGAYDEEGRLLAPADMPEDVRRAIAGFEEDALFETVSVPDGEKEKKVRLQVGVTRKIKWASKAEVLGLAAKRMGLLVDRSEVKVESGEPALTDEEWAALAELRHKVRGKAAGKEPGAPA